MDSGSPPEVLRDLYRFHLDARETRWSPLDEGILPAALQEIREPQATAATLATPEHRASARFHSEYPIFLGSPEAGGETLPLSLTELLRRAAPAADDIAADDIAVEATVSQDHLQHLEDHVRHLADSHVQPQDARELLAEASRALVADVGAETAEGERLKHGLEHLLAAVPEGGRLLPYSAQAPLHLFLQAALERLGAAREAFREETRALVAQAEALLEADRLKHPEGRDRNGDAMGDLGSRFIDPSVLTQTLGCRVGGSVLPAMRGERLREAVDTLRRAVAAEREPLVLLVHDGHHGIPGLEQLGVSDRPWLWRVVTAEDPCAFAAELFDREAEKVAQVLRAARRVRLEAQGKYDPERQDPWLERFDWQAFTRRDLLLLPPVVALVAADRLAREGLVSLSRLLLSGRPVQVLVPVEPARNPGAELGAELRGFRFEPAYLGLSHREALVQQTTTARPAHLARGLHRALSATHAGLHIISSGGGETAPMSPSPELRALVAVEGRAHPLLYYDPEAGPSWAERLDFSHNPQAGEDWPCHDVTVASNGGAESFSAALTFADYALLEPSHARHFQSVPDAIADDDLIPLPDYCRQRSTDPTSRIPFVRAMDGKSQLRRLAVSRPLALACRDRLDFWHVLQELAGVRSEHARRAAEAARKSAEEHAVVERARLQAAHARELEELRQSAAREVVDRLTSALLEVDVTTFATADLIPDDGPGSPVPKAPASTPTPTVEAPIAEPQPAAEPPTAAPESNPEPEPEAEASADIEPYIDTELCTTCNECTNLNPEMFAYDDNKQAFIKDPRAGTFEQLVTAAERCTAHIIHPGTPLDADEPHLESWIQRAKPFN